MFIKLVEPKCIFGVTTRSGKTTVQASKESREPSELVHSSPRHVHFDENLESHQPTSSPVSFETWKGGPLVMMRERKMMIMI